MDILVEKLDKKMREWKPDTIAKVRQKITEIIELADNDALDIIQSRFVEQEVLDNVKRDRFHRALEISSGAWKDEDHPELVSIDDIAKCVRDMRKDNDKRLKEIYHE